MDLRSRFAADAYRLSEVEDRSHLTSPVRLVGEAVMRKPAQIGWLAHTWRGWCRIAIADDGGAERRAKRDDIRKLVIVRKHDRRCRMGDA